jgi:hypothetical protein
MHFSYEDKTGIIKAKHFKRKKISLEHYINRLKTIVDFNIKQTFLNKKLILAYSGGIDSLVILSFIIKNNLQNKITLVNFTNNLSNPIPRSFAYEKKIGLDVQKFDINLKELITIANSSDNTFIRLYTSFSFLQKFKNSNIIFGYHGNQSLLHKKIFLEQIKKDVTQVGYCSSLNNWKVEKNCIPLEEHCLVRHKWHRLNGINLCNIFYPLGNNEIFEMIRQIDWQNIDPHVISDARVARRIIQDNVGHLLDPIVTNENLADNETIVGDLQIPLKKLNKKIFEIDNFCSQRGYGWLISEYNTAKQTGSIKLNSLVSFINVKKYFSNIN